MTNRRLSSADSLSRGRLGSTFCAIKTERKTTSWLSDFTVKDTIGRGRFAVVKKCVENSTGKFFAAKCIRKRRHNRDCTLDILHEIAVLELSTDHPHLIDLHRVYESPSEVILILEYAAGGEIFDHCVDVKDRFSEADARRIMLQILDAVTFLHDNGIVHLDLKPQNILLTKEGTKPDADIKLVDFGLSKHITNDLEIREILGTPDYAAPEVLNFEPISIATDIWSLGVVCYVVLTGVSPFLGDTKQETLMNVTTGAIQFPADLFGELSPSCEDLIHKMLQRDPEDRITAKDSLFHPWIVGTSSPRHLLSVGKDSPSSTDEVFIFSKSTSISVEVQNGDVEHEEQKEHDLIEKDEKKSLNSTKNSEKSSSLNGPAPSLNLEESEDQKTKNSIQNSTFQEVDINGNISGLGNEQETRPIREVKGQPMDPRIKQRLSSSDQAKVPDTQVTESSFAQLLYQDSFISEISLTSTHTTDVNDNSIQISHLEPKARVISCLDEKLAGKISTEQDVSGAVAQNHASAEENSQNSRDSDSSLYSRSLNSGTTEAHSTVNSPNLNSLSLASLAGSPAKIHSSEAETPNLFSQVSPLSNFDSPTSVNYVISNFDDRYVDLSSRCQVVNSLCPNPISNEPNETISALNDVFSGSIDPSQKRRKFDVFDRSELQQTPIED